MSRRLATHVLCLLIPLIASQTTREPSWAPTGKLNQFRGFVTPRPLPPNADFVYASVWGGWSAWSFCSNGMKIRVRACNTVRGFNCLGPNQEFLPCDHNVFPPTNHVKAPNDYDVVDPYEADRREAMKQLYPDDFPSEPSPPTKPVLNFLKIPKSQASDFRRMHAAQPTPSLQEPIELERALKELLIEKPTSGEAALRHHLSSEQIQIHQEELDNALNSLQLRGEGKIGAIRGRHSAKEAWESDKLFVPLEKMSPKIQNGIFSSGKNSTEIKSVEKIPLNKEKEDVNSTISSDHEDITSPDFLLEDDATMVESQNISIPTNNEHNEPPRVDLDKEAPPPPETSTSDPKDVADLFIDEDHFEQFGTRPEIVQPKLSNTIDEDPEPEVVTPDGPEDITFSTTTTTTAPTTTSTAPFTVASTTQHIKISMKPVKQTTRRLDSSRANKFDGTINASKRVDSAVITSYGVSKQVPGMVMKQKKTKGFGFTGFAVRKAFDAKRFIHTGEVTKMPQMVDQSSQAACKGSREKEEIPAKIQLLKKVDEELSPDTLRALDWMLQNITKIAQQNEESFREAFNGNHNEVDSTGFPIPRELFVEAENSEIVKPVKLQKSRKTGKKPRKMRKGTKRKGGRKDQSMELHSGEFKPMKKRNRKSFPKFRSRMTDAVQARSFGVRIVDNERPRNLETPQKVEADGKAVNPSALIEEIAKLEAAMNSVERKVEEAEGNAVPFEGNAIQYRQSIPKSVEYTDETAGLAYRRTTRTESIATTPTYPTEEGPEVAMDLNLVPVQKGFLPGANAEFHQQPIHFITEGSTDHEETRWTEWGQWADCFCGKQVRTRRCIYSGIMSQGCQGDSYESRDCVGGSCPVPTERHMPVLRKTTSQPQIHDPHRELRPLKLYTAVSQS